MDYFEQQKRNIDRGELRLRIVLLISAAMLLVDTVWSQFVRFDFLGIILFVFHIVVLMLMYLGRGWAKWWFVVTGVISILLSMWMYAYAIPAGLFSSPGGVAQFAVSCVYSILQIYATVLVLSNPHVKEFLYDQSTKPW